MKVNIFRNVLMVILLCSFLQPALGQGEVIGNIRDALKAGSSKELVKYFNKSTDLDIDGERATYSRTQAEGVLRDFFRNFAPTNFQVIHQGASRAGSPYVIGQYSHKSGSFRVWIRLKEESDIFEVHAMSFYKD